MHQNWVCRAIAVFGCDSGGNTLFPEIAIAQIIGTTSLAREKFKIGLKRHIENLQDSGIA
ncbi:MAG: hypothetical protein SVX43_22620 [Cyanobacteriota bacterium]|nr:hypothetical protein [Cyanobacteriota bacterium]